MGENYKTVFQKDDSVLTVQPEGRLDAVTAPLFSEQLEKELEGISQIVVDLAQVDYISSAGLRVLLMSEQKMETRGGGMKLVNVNEGILEVLTLTGFLDFVTIE